MIQGVDLNQDFVDAWFQDPVLDTEDTSRLQIFCARGLVTGKPSFYGVLQMIYLSMAYNGDYPGNLRGLPYWHSVNPGGDAFPAGAVVVRKEKHGNGDPCEWGFMPDDLTRYTCNQRCPQAGFLCYGEGISEGFWVEVGIKIAGPVYRRPL